MNNNFISAEKFLKQSEKVQDNIKTWLELNMQEKEWVKLTKEKCTLYVSEVLDTRKENINVGRVFYFGECLCWTSIYEPNVVPLLQIHQLINFIEGTTKKDLSHWRDIDDNEFTIYLTNKKFEEEFQGNIIVNQQEFKGMGLNLLEALWQVTIQIIEGE